METYSHSCLHLPGPWIPLKCTTKEQQAGFHLAHVMLRLARDRVPRGSELLSSSMAEADPSGNAVMLGP